MSSVGHIGERPVMIVVIERGRSAFVWQAEIVGSDIADVLDIVTGNEKIFPTVIVEVEEPGGKAEFGFADACPGGDLAEFPMAVSIGTIVVKQLVGSAKNGQVQVRASVVIIVGASNAFDE